MTSIRPADDSAPAAWLLASGVDWWTLVRYGPPGFDAYVRIAFDDDGDDPPIDRFTSVLQVLTAFTSALDTGYAAVWEGWGPPPPQAPRVDIPNRTMLLFTAPVAELRVVPAVGWHQPVAQVAVAPHLAWPADHAWCLACEVDEEIEFTVGCSTAAAEALSAALPGAVRHVGYGDPAPLYRDEPPATPDPSDRMPLFYRDEPPAAR